MKKLAILLWALSMPIAYGQSQNFEGFGLAFDYSLNSITDVSTPGGSATSRSGIPSITADAYKAISDQWLVHTELMIWQQRIHPVLIPMLNIPLKRAARWLMPLLKKSWAMSS